MTDASPIPSPSLREGNGLGYYLKLAIPYLHGITADHARGSRQLLPFI